VSSFNEAKEGGSKASCAEAYRKELRFCGSGTCGRGRGRPRPQRNHETSERYWGKVEKKKMDKYISKTKKRGGKVYFKFDFWAKLKDIKGR